MFRVRQSDGKCCAHPGALVVAERADVHADRLAGGDLLRLYIDQPTVIQGKKILIIQQILLKTSVAKGHGNARDYPLDGIKGKRANTR